MQKCLISAETAVRQLFLSFFSFKKQRKSSRAGVCSYNGTDIHYPDFPQSVTSLQQSRKELCIIHTVSLTNKYSPL